MPKTSTRKLWGKPHEWAWGDERTECYAAGSRTKKEAIEHVEWTASEEMWEKPRQIVIGRVVWPEPARYANIDVDVVVEQMDVNASNDGICIGDDSLFDFHDVAKAQTELTNFIRRWANKHLSPSKWTFEKVEEIVVSRRGVKSR